MASRPEIPERTPIDKVEVEYERASGASKARRPGFTRVRLLAISQTEIELATREAIPIGEKLNFTLDVKGVKNFVRAAGEIKKRTVQISVLKQPAFSVTVQIGKLTSDQTAKMAWAEEQLMPRQRMAPRRREEEPPAAAAPAAAGQPAPPAAATAVAEGPAPVETVPAADETAPGVNRPVALLQLLEALDKFEVNDDLVMAIVEAAEAGLDVETLYAAKTEELIEESEESSVADVVMPSDGIVRPMNVYRFADNTRLYFSEANAVIGPPSGLVYLSRIQTPQTCFALELGSDSMMNAAGGRSFKPGSILIFSSDAKVENGDFAYVKTRMGDEFAQVFMEKNEDLRLRPLNPQYREHLARRTEIQIVCKLVGWYEDLTG
ncbi:MAG: S24 family peptidase [Candidatus Brocadiia bacterium]|jgi:phage repressor protein C with HTH and peptisase S24 domain